MHFLYTFLNCLIISINVYFFQTNTEEVILAEERTTEEEKMHIIEGEIYKFHKFLRLKLKLFFFFFNSTPKSGGKTKKIKKLG